MAYVSNERRLHGSSQPKLQADSRVPRLDNLKVLRVASYSRQLAMVDEESHSQKTHRGRHESRLIFRLGKPQMSTGKRNSREKPFEK